MEDKTCRGLVSRKIRGVNLSILSKNSNRHFNPCRGMISIAISSPIKYEMFFFENTKKKLFHRLEHWFHWLGAYNGLSSVMVVRFVQVAIAFICKKTDYIIQKEDNDSIIIIKVAQQRPRGNQQKIHLSEQEKIIH